jgi:hypothetical protein
MRFAVSATLDAIEGRLTLDPALARGVVDLAEVVRMVDVDDDTAKPASLLRLGHLIDALAVYVAEGGVAVYPVVARSLLSDLDLTSNERMVVRRWADDGLVEVLDRPGDRVLEVAELLAVPVLSRQPFTGLAERYPWLPAGLLAPSPAGLSARGEPVPPRAGTRAMTRLWRCPEPDCAGYAAPSGAQPPPQLVAGAPTCPRHQQRLADAGPRPSARVLAVRVDGAVVRRTVVRPQAPVVVGRSPERRAAEVAVALAAWLGEAAMRWVSRSHVRLELDGDALVVHDRSTNGTTVRTRGGPVRLAAGQAYEVATDDVIELYQGVELARPELMRGGPVAPASVMAEAPTIAIRRPRPD